MKKFYPISFVLACLFLVSSCGNFAKISKIGLPDANDYKHFAFRNIENDGQPFHFYLPDHDPNLGKTIELDSRRIDAEDDYLDEFLKDHKTLSFLIIRNDTILYQYYDESRSDTSIVTSFSVAKAFVSALVGIAIDEGKIEGECTSITKYLPELTNQGFDQVTIENLLDHTSGIHYKEIKNHVGGNLEFYYGKNLKKDVFNISPAYPPAQRFEYSNINTQLLSVILQRATGKNVSEYLEEKIWKPLGMEYPASWSLSDDGADGVEKAFCCINARTIDFAKFGRLYMNHGNWNGKQIVPKWWVDESLDSSKEGGQRLTYHHNWGIGPKKYGSFYAVGLYGQLIYMYPEKNVIIVRFGKADLGYNPPFLLHTFIQICDQL